MNVCQVYLMNADSVSGSRRTSDWASQLGLLVYLQVAAIHIHHHHLLLLLSM